MSSRRRREAREDELARAGRPGAHIGTAVRSDVQTLLRAGDTRALGQPGIADLQSRAGNRPVAQLLTVQRGPGKKGGAKGGGKGGGKKGGGQKEEVAVDKWADWKSLVRKYDWDDLISADDAYKLKKNLSLRAGESFLGHVVHGANFSKDQTFRQVFQNWVDGLHPSKHPFYFDLAAQAKAGL